MTSLVNDWVNNGVANNGIVLLSTGADNGDAKYGTRENTNAADYKPKLQVNWWLAPNQGATTVTRLQAPARCCSAPPGQVRVTMEITASATITNVTPPTNLAVGSAGRRASRSGRQHQDQRPDPHRPPSPSPLAAWAPSSGSTK